MVGAVSDGDVVVRRCLQCGEYFGNRIWDGNYLCAACRGESQETDEEEKKG